MSKKKCVLNYVSVSKQVGMAMKIFDENEVFHPTCICCPLLKCLAKNVGVKYSFHSGC